MTRFDVLVVATLLLSSMGSAQAFSTQSGDNTYKGSNVSNFADPDEQQPAFLTGSGDASPQQPRQVTVGEDQNTQRERYMGLSQSFDQSYSNK